MDKRQQWPARGHAGHADNTHTHARAHYFIISQISSSYCLQLQKVWTSFGEPITEIPEDGWTKEAVVALVFVFLLLIFFLLPTMKMFNNFRLTKLLC
jgi:hypothetical protein